MTTELTKAAQRLDDFLSQFDDDEQERVLQYALDHVVPRLKSRALTQRPAAQTEREAFESAALAKWGPLDFERSEVEPEMYYNQRLDDAWIGFGFAVAWLRASLPAPQQATPATPEDMKVYGGIAAGYFADTQQATPEPAQADSSEHLRVITSLGTALRRLSFAAQTSGGTAGPDAELQAAIGQAEQALSYGGIAQAMFPATPEPVGWTDADADAARLAMELECLLLDTKDTAAVSRWWKSANEALDLHRARLAAAQAKGAGHE